MGCRVDLGDFRGDGEMARVRKAPTSWIQRPIYLFLTTRRALVGVEGPACGVSPLVVVVASSYVGMASSNSPGCGAEVPRKLAFAFASSNDTFKAAFSVRSSSTCRRRETISAASGDISAASQSGSMNSAQRMRSSAKCNLSLSPRVFSWWQQQCGISMCNFQGCKGNAQCRRRSSLPFSILVPGPGFSQ